MKLPQRLQEFFNDEFVKAIMQKAIIGAIFGFLFMMWISAIVYLMTCSMEHRWVGWDWWMFVAMQILSMTTGAFLGFLVEISS